MRAASCPARSRPAAEHRQRVQRRPEDLGERVDVMQVFQQVGALPPVGLS